MIDIIRSIWTSRDRAGFLRSVIVFVAGVIGGALAVLGIVWKEPPKPTDK